MAGTAVPDWLSFIDRRIRARQKYAEPFVADVDPQIADVARGIVQHHVDDHRFHTCRAFTELSLDFAVQLRDVLADEKSMRPSFLGHILVELLLDSYLHQKLPGHLDRYYQALRSLRPEVVQSAVNRIVSTAKTRRPMPQTDKLVKLIPRFADEGFLYDYGDDIKLLFRLNQVMKRIGLHQIPDDVLPFVEKARVAVNLRAEELLDTNGSQLDDVQSRG